MNSSFNRQFILIDFRLLTNKKFLKFIGSSEFATYLVLRCNVWRSQEPHYMVRPLAFTKAAAPSVWTGQQHSLVVA